jgi:hypothetical protein
MPTSPLGGTAAAFVLCRVSLPLLRRSGPLITGLGAMMPQSMPPRRTQRRVVRTLPRETLCGTMRRLPNGRQLFHGLPEKAVLVQSDNAVKRVSEYSSQSIRNCCNASFHRCVGKPVAMQLHNLFDITASTWHAIWERYRNV